MTRIRTLIPLTTVLMVGPALMSCERDRQDETDQTGKVVEQPATTGEDPMMAEPIRQTEPTDQTGTTEPTGQAGTAEPTGQTGMVDSTSKQLLQDIHKTNLAEVKMAELVTDRDVSPAVKNLAERLKQEHSQSNDKLENLSEQMKMNLDLQDELPQEAEQKMTQLEGAQGNTFEQQFVQTQIQMHEKKIDSLKNSLSQVQDPQVRDFVQTTINHMEEHLKQAREVQSQLGRSQ